MALVFAGRHCRIEHPGALRLAESLGCLAGSTNDGAGAAERLLEHARRLRLSLEAIASLSDESGCFVATALALPSPGKTAQIVVTPPPTLEDAEALGAIIDAACARLPEDISVAQALVEPIQTGAAADTPLVAALHRGGFESLAQLDYMLRAMPRRSTTLPAQPRLPRGITIEPWVRGDNTLLEVLEGSYEETLDCPGLCGLRHVEDILAGHLAGGRHEPNLWLLLREDARATGALLMSPSHRMVGGASEEIEIVYLGLVRSSRGRGLGAGLLARGLALLTRRPEQRIVLAVDRANAPALRLYASAGFVAGASRLALIRPLRAAGPRVKPHAAATPRSQLFHRA